MRLRKASFVNRQKLNSLIKQTKVFADEDNNLKSIHENLKHSEPEYLINLLTDDEIRELEHEGIIELEVR